MKLITPVIKSWDCPDHDPLEDWVPEDRAVTDFWINLAIGIEGEAGADNFQVHVVTRRALSQVGNKEFILVLPYYEGVDQVISAINERIGSIQELSWDAVAKRLSAMFRWEFDGLR